MLARTISTRILLILQKIMHNICTINTHTESYSGMALGVVA